MASPGEIEKLERRWLENMQGLTFAPLAEAYRKAGRLDEAFQTLELGLAHHPDYIPAHIVRGRCALDAGNDAAAATAFALVLSFDSLNLIALRGLAEISLRSGRPQEAILHLRRLLDVDRTDAEAAKRLVELQAAATQAPASEYARQPAESVAPSPDSDSPATETIFPLVNLADPGAPPDSADDLVSFSDPGPDAPDPMDLRIDDRWSYPGEAGEFAVAHDSETLSAPEDPAETDTSESDLASDWSAPEVSLPSLDVVSTLKDLPENEPGTTDSDSAEEPTPSSLAGEGPDGEIHSEEPGVWMALETEADAETVEPPLADPDGMSEVTLRLLETEPEVPAHPWFPAELPHPATAEGDNPTPEDVPSIEVVSEETGSTAELPEEERELPDPGEPGSTEPLDDAAQATGTDGLHAVPEIDIPRDAWSSTEEDDLEAPSVVPEAEGAPSPGSSWGWMSDEAEREEMPEPAQGEMSAAGLDDRGEETSRATNPGLGPEEEAPLPAEVEAEVVEDDVEGDEDALVVTETMAEIFLRQGHDELALAVYTELARRDPEDARLQDAIARLTPTPPEAAAPEQTSTPAVPGRFAASSTGGESLGDFLSGVLAVREPISPTAVTPPAMDRPREGAPTRPADKHFGLDAVFGDDPTDASVPAPAAEEGEGASPSFDEFFGDRPPVVAPPSSSSPASDSEDLQHFNDWLKGLKR